MFELATFYHGEPDPSVLLVVFSRDDLLLAASECLVQRGHNVIIAVGASSNGTPLLTEVPVVVLASLQQATASIVAALLTPVPAPAIVDTSGVKLDKQVVSAALNNIRQSLKPNKQGEYEASAVGQILYQLGHDKAMRTKIVKQIPNLKEVGTGSEKRLIF